MARLMLRLALLAFATIATSTTVTYPANTDLSKQLGCTPLRILCIGDSITQGSLSSSGDGYRGYLQSLLINSTSGAAFGADVDFVGTLRMGNMTDNSHDGKSGGYLADLVPLVQQAIGSHPNVILIHAGSNDLDKLVNVSGAIDRLETVVRAAHDGSPNATIFLAQLIVSNPGMPGGAPMQKQIDIFNPQVPGLVSKLSAENISIVDVNMSHILNASEIADRKHPDDLGYSIMAKAWHNAIANATLTGMIKQPDAPAELIKGLGLGLEGELLTPNITCKLEETATMTTASASGRSNAAASGAGTTSPSGSVAAPSQTNGANSITVVASPFVLALSLLLIMLSTR